ncbi:hypothetical protein RS030_203229 [Cryptosporidium xiaoi]|uniref:A-kinase anchor protein 7-like phosphoesterase domain-containing protein n=1 Tax=Cryptosporidium xiaoi TaxID=659607 RepID=A0AAV9XXL7_9CRYT
MESYKSSEIKDCVHSIETDFSDFPLNYITVSREFISDEIETLDNDLNFPPKYSKILEVDENEKLKVKSIGYENEMIIEHVDLNAISKINLRKFRSMIYTKKVEVNKSEQNDESHSDFSDDDDDFSNNNIKTNRIKINDAYCMDELEFSEEIGKKSDKSTINGFSINNDIIELKYNKNPTHFISLTFNKYSNELISGFRIFKKTILNSVDFGNEINTSYFISEHNLHITLGLVRIDNSMDFLNCKNALLQLKETKEFSDLTEISSKVKGFPIIIQGLSCFGSSNKTKVVYGKLHEKNKVVILKRLWNRLCKILVDNKVSVTISESNNSISHNEDDKDNIIAINDKALEIFEILKHSFNPHVTFINTKYGSSGGKHRTTFDSSKLKQVFSNKKFGTGYISGIELNELSKHNFSEENTKLKLKDNNNDSVSSCKKYNSIFSVELI